MDMIFIYFSSEDLGILLGFFLAKKHVKKIIIIQLPTTRSDSLVLLRSNDCQYYYYIIRKNVLLIKAVIVFYNIINECLMMSLVLMIIVRLIVYMLYNGSCVNAQALLSEKEKKNLILKFNPNIFTMESTFLYFHDLIKHLRIYSK